MKMKAFHNDINPRAWVRDHIDQSRNNGIPLLKAISFFFLMPLHASELDLNLYEKFKKKLRVLRASLCGVLALRSLLHVQLRMEAQKIR